jgi:hypothetical protein
MDSGAGHQPDPVALERVRRDLADLGTDATSAPEVPPAVTARVVAALRAQRGPAHAIRRPGLPRLQMLGLIIGLGAAVAGVVVGALMLVRDPAPTRSHGPTAESITVSRPPRDLPLSDPQIVALMSRAPDYGPLTDPQRRESCLDGLGYSAMQVLGAQPLDMYGRPAVLMLLPGDTPKTVRGLVVEPHCNSAHTGLLANTLVTRP